MARTVTDSTSCSPPFSFGPLESNDNREVHPLCPLPSRAAVAQTNEEAQNMDSYLTAKEAYIKKRDSPWRRPVWAKGQ